MIIVNIHKHKFDPKNKNRLEKKERLDFYDIDAVIEWFGIKEDEVVAEVGAGTGFFTRRLSKLSAKVYAIDISSELLKDIGGVNVEAVLAEESKIPLQSGVADFVFLAYVVHEFAELQKSLVEIKRILKPNGRVGIIEWEKVEMDEGPSYNDRIASCEMNKIIEKNGLVVLKNKSLAKGHYALLAGEGG